VDILNLVTGIFLIGSGFLVKSEPDLIAGYNTLPKEKKKNVDIEGLSTYMRNGLIIIGLTIIIGYYLFKWIGFTKIANSMILISTLIGVTVLVIITQKFDHNKETNTKLIYFILGIVILIEIGLISYLVF
jgi:hypothetical protein